MAATDERDGALATAAVAAAAGAAVYGLRKALASSGSSGGASSPLPGRNDSDDDGEQGGGRLFGTGGSLLSTVWDSASGSLMPLAEEAAEAAGKWVGENAPDLVRERIVRRFIEAYEDAT